jgi:hypothetical protein
VPSIYQPRRPRASPLWQLVHHGWDEFLANYEKRHRKDLGPLHPAAIATVESFLRCGDLASGFTRLQCPDCGHERLLAFTCKGRHFCPSCHQRRVRSTSDWIATAVCHEVPHRQFVFTIPKVLRGIFRKRRQLLTHLFHTATETLRDAFRIRLKLPDGKLGAIAAVHTFGDYLIFHPHLHVLAADGLFAPDGRFHCMPVEDLAPAIELFRQRFLHALREAKLINPKKLADLLAWKHSGFHIHDGGEKPVPAHDSAGRKRLAEYLLRHPFSLQKITWNETTKTVIYRSKRHHTTKRNFEIFKAPDFIAAALLHLPPKGQQTVRYYGVYSNKTRGLTSPIPDHIIRPPAPSANQQSKINNHQSEILLIPAPPKQSARDMRPLWRDLILQVWGGDPLECPCCKGTLKPVRQVIRREEIQFFLRLHGLWEGLIQLPRPPPPPFDIYTMEPIEPPWLAIKEWIPDDEPNLDWFNRPRDPDASDPDRFDQPVLRSLGEGVSPAWQASEVPLGDGYTLVLENS